MGSSFLAFAAALAGQVSIASPPSAAKEGDGFRVTFTLGGATDVEVAIVSAEGKVVRHLAAGRVGPEATPPEPLRPGLAQSILWDGKDDAGNAAAGGPFSARVRAGLKPEFEGFLLHNPEGTGPIGALATGPGGTVYLFHHDGTSLPSHWGSKKIKIIGRDGRHVRALTPFPADIPAERIRALGAFRDEDGSWVPRVHHLRHLSVYPDPGTLMASHSSPVVDGKGRAYWLVKGPAVCAVDPDGGVPYDAFVGPKLFPDVKNLRLANQYLAHLDTPVLAMSGDEKHLYVAGLSAGEFGKDKEHRPVPCVFRVDVATRGPGEVFLGRLGEPGKEGASLTSPRGLAVGKGIVYVADREADRVVAFKEDDRSFVGEIRVKSPQTVGVDPATGALYVCAYT
jgi:hypothetical protein